MPPKKIAALPGCPSCPRGLDKEKCFITPELVEKPELLVVGEFPTRNDIKNKGMFSGDSGKILYGLLDKHDVEHVAFINAANCYGEEKPSTAVITACRDAYVAPTLARYPGVPVLALGAFAASSLLGGRRSEGKLSGTVRIIDGREVYFTYHPSHFLQEGRNHRILHHIEVMLASCLASVRNRKKAEYIIGVPPDEFYNCETIYVDLETTDEKGPWYGTQVVVVGLANNRSDVVWVVPHFHSDSQSLLDRLLPLADFEGRVVNHNLNFDLCFLWAHGLYPKKATFGDTQVFERCRPVVKMYGEVGLKWLLKSRYGYNGYEAKVHTQWKVEGKNCSEIMLADVAEYCAIDVVGTKQLDLDQQKEEHPNLHIYNLTMDYFRYLVEMEMNGLFVDRGIHEVLARENKENTLSQMLAVAAIVETRVLVDVSYAPFITSEMTKVLLTEETLQKGDTAFNPRSHAQVKKFLSERGVDLPDTQAETLEQFKGKHPLIDALAGLRGVEKLGGTYFEGYRPWIDKGGLIHSSFGAQGTESGRCNSTDPNVQNTPKAARKMFVSRFPGGVLISPDLSALEYRIIAHVTQDSRLLETFKTGRDIHKFSASTCFGVKMEAVDAEMRQVGKILNYAGVYGAGKTKFYSLLGRKDERLFQKVQNLYPGVNRWKAKLLARLHDTGRVITIFGRVREFDTEISQNEEREAINWSIQSTGHDIFKIFLMAALDEAREQWLADGILLVNENHDSFVWDCKPECAKQAEGIVLRLGNNLNGMIKEAFGVEMTVPILSDVKVSSVWG